ncbi:hypothetical protein K474DRAFT_1678272 [Panus rudis PR-1116 ss-1]|nr:hypothetical protein K474DRAFT_1678272 [Panus rudis PR-1116 ss-1]
MLTGELPPVLRLAKPKTISREGDLTRSIAKDRMGYSTVGKAVKGHRAIDSNEIAESKSLNIEQARETLPGFQDSRKSGPRKSSLSLGALGVEDSKEGNQWKRRSLKVGGPERYAVTVTVCMGRKKKLVVMMGWWGIPSGVICARLIVRLCAPYTERLNRNERTIDESQELISFVQCIEASSGNLQWWEPVGNGTCVTKVQIMQKLEVGKVNATQRPGVVPASMSRTTQKYIQCFAASVGAAKRRASNL